MPGVFLPQAWYFYAGPPPSPPVVLSAPGVHKPLAWYFIVGSSAPAVPAATDLIEAIVRFGRTDGELVVAFPDKSPSNRAFIFGQSNLDPPVPRCVVTVVGDTPPLTNTGRGVVYTTLVQFSVFAGNTAQSRSLGRLVRDKFRRQPLSFQDGYWIWAEPHVPRPMPPEQGPGTSFIYQTVVEVTYTVGNAYGPAVA